MSAGSSTPPSAAILPGGRALIAWWRRRSLRARLTAASTVVIAIGMAAAGALLVWRLQAGLLAGVDTTVGQQAGDIATALRDGQSASALTASGDTAIVQVVAAGTGRVVTSSANIEGEPPLFAVHPAAGTPTRYDTTLPLDGEGGYRVAALATPTPSGLEFVYVARSTSEISASVGQLVFGLTIVAPVLMVAFALLAWLLVGRALRPVETMRQQAERIPGTAPRHRLAPPPTGDELARLAATFNSLLDRIDIVARQQRQFVADAAHELRSPVAALRAQLDIEAGHPELPTVPADRAALAADAARLGRLVDDLLTLARLDASPHLPRRAVDLDDLVIAEIRRARALATCDIVASGVSAGRVLGDPDALDRVVRNVLDNATRHARHQVAVAVRTDFEAGAVTLAVADDGPGIPPADRERVFQRFTRLEPGRPRSGGAGLGLAIIHEVVIAHGGTVRIEDNQPGARVIITLPIGPVIPPDIAFSAAN
jgi:signal transduction histidine kinase